MMAWWQLMLAGLALVAVSAVPALGGPGLRGRLIALAGYACGFAAMWTLASEHVR